MKRKIICAKGLSIDIRFDYLAEGERLEPRRMRIERVYQRPAVHRTVTFSLYGPDRDKVPDPDKLTDEAFAWFEEAEARGEGPLYWEGAPPVTSSMSDWASFAAARSRFRRCSPSF